MSSKESTKVFNLSSRECAVCSRLLTLFISALFTGEADDSACVTGGELALDAEFTSLLLENQKLVFYFILVSIK